MFINLFIYGLLLTLLITWVLKETIKAERPQKGKETYSDGGMPSGHTSTTAFVLFFIALYFNNILLYILALIGTILMAKSRVDKEMHTPSQTIAGAILGITIAIYVKFKNQRQI